MPGAGCHRVGKSSPEFVERPPPDWGTVAGRDFSYCADALTIALLLLPLAMSAGASR
jgi:hypothetical protein